MAFRVRRLVTGHDAAGRACFTSDGAPPFTVEDPASGYAASNLWSLDAPPASPDAGGEPAAASPWELEPPPGGLSWRLVRMPPPRPGSEDALAARAHGDARFDAERPGFHRTDTLDFMQVLDGRIALELHDEERELGPGDCVVQRGTWHRWRVLGERPCHYAVAMLRPAPGAPPPALARAPAAGGGGRGIGPRRVATGVAGGRSVFASDGRSPRAFAVSGSGFACAELWQTGGPLRDPLQGGDLADRAWALHPAGGGLAWRVLTLPPERELSAADAEAGAREVAAQAPGFGADGRYSAAQPGLHRTETLDLILVTDGALELSLPGAAPRRVMRGDAVVQRGTWHAWRVLGDAPCTFSVLMLGAPPFPPGRVAEP